MIRLVPVLLASALLVGCAGKSRSPVYKLEVGQNMIGSTTIELSNPQKTYTYICVLGQVEGDPTVSATLTPTAPVPIDLTSGFVHIATDVEADDLGSLDPSMRPPWWVVRNHTSISGADGTKFIFQTLPRLPSDPDIDPTRVIMLSNAPSIVRYGDRTTGVWVQRGELTTAMTFVEYMKDPATGLWKWTQPAPVTTGSDAEKAVLEANSLLTPPA